MLYWGLGAHLGRPILQTMKGRSAVFGSRCCHVIQNRPIGSVLLAKADIMALTGRAGSKIRALMRAARRKIGRFDLVAEGSELPNHLGSACLLGFGAHFWAAFFITDIVVQNLPDQPANPMRDGPGGLLVFQTRLQTAKHTSNMLRFTFTAARADDKIVRATCHM
jgi:hypothetical protein